MKNEPEFTQDWFSYNIPIWRSVLTKCLKNKPNRFLEVGCFEGRATTFLLNEIMKKEDQIDVIDTFEGSMEHEIMKVDVKGMFARFLKNINNDRRVIIHVGKSENILRAFSDKSDYFDFVYIDGSHRAKDVLTDAILSWLLLKKDGILIFDDYKWRPFPREIENPFPAIITFLDYWQDEYEIAYKDYQVILRKNV